MGMPAILWLESLDNRQATKRDLLDIANALGEPVFGVTHTVPELRRIVRERIENLRTKAAEKAP